MSQMKILAPVAAKALAISSPMPEPPAVINTRCTSKLLLRLGGEIKRIAGLFAKFGRLLGLGVGDILGEHRNHAGASAMRGHHHLVGVLGVHPEHRLEHLHDEFARGEIVIEQDHLPKLWALNFGLYFGAPLGEDLLGHRSHPGASPCGLPLVWGTSLHL